MAMRSPETDERRPIREMIRKLIKAPAALSVLWPILLIVGGYIAWHQWGSVHVANQYSGIDPTMIRVTTPPKFVRTDVVKSVYSDTAMEGLSLLDRQATAKIASAFSMHPWVRKVIGVRKLPGGSIDVRLEYRRPVAMVHVFKPSQNDTRSYFFPVDQDGVLLPTNEFARAETKNFLYIEVPGVYTTNPVGSSFGDSRVEAAAKLAGLLAPHREAAQLRSIGVYGDPRQVEVPQLELTTQNGTQIPWGSPPGSELPGEPTMEMKLQKLLTVDAGQLSDLRLASPMVRSQR